MLVFYALAFPRNRIGFALRLIWFPRYFHIGAIAALALWLVIQCWSLFLQHVGWTNVSAVSHLGGAAVGLAAWWLFRLRLRAELGDR